MEHREEEAKEKVQEKTEDDEDGYKTVNIMGIETRVKINK